MNTRDQHTLPSLARSLARQVSVGSMSSSWSSSSSMSSSSSFHGHRSVHFNSRSRVYLHDLDTDSCRRSVHFNPRTRVYLVLSRHDMTPEEIKSTWIPEEEIEDIKMGIVDDVRALRNNNNPTITTTSTCSQSSQNNKQREEEERHCSRGLERMISICSQATTEMDIPKEVPSAAPTASTKSQRKSAPFKAGKTLAKAAKKASSKNSKKRTWKKPKDKPKRPLSAYNFFFKEERKNIMSMSDNKNAPRPSTSRGSAPNNKRTPQSHGLGFAGLARSIATRWRSLDDAARGPFDRLASMDKDRYDNEVEVWRRMQATKKEKQQKEKAAVADQQQQQ